MNQKTSVEDSRPLRVIVVGGSHSGLLTALALGAVNCNVEVFERSPHEMKERGAGIVLQPETLQFLSSHGIATKEAISILPKIRQDLGRDSKVTREEVSYLSLMTSWDCLYRQLRAAFPDQHYHKGNKLVSFEQDENQVIGRFNDGQLITCDLLVCADGANSTCRRRLLPDIALHYAGYVAWRGVIEESEVSPEVASVFTDKFIFFKAPQTHIMCYMIPGNGGELSKGKRRFNWVWYWNVPEGEQLRQVLTDRTGRFRDYSVPQGTIRQELVEQQRAIAQNVLPEVFLHLFEQTLDPFIQPIYDLSVPQMVFGRVCLTGDAAFVLRPHTGASTSKAATNAMELAKEVQLYKGDVVTALKKWEVSQLELGNDLKALGISRGNLSQFAIDGKDSGDWLR